MRFFMQTPQLCPSPSGSPGHPPFDVNFPEFSWKRLQIRLLGARVIWSCINLACCFIFTDFWRSTGYFILLCVEVLVLDRCLAVDRDSFSV